MFAFSLFMEEVWFVRGSFRGETPCASCLAFLISEKSFLGTNPESFPVVSLPSSVSPRHSTTKLQPSLWLVSAKLNHIRTTAEAKSKVSYPAPMQLIITDCS